MAGDGDGRYRNGRRVTLRLTTEQNEKLMLLSSEVNASPSMVLRVLLDTAAEMDVDERRKLLAEKTTAA